MLVLALWEGGCSTTVRCATLTGENNIHFCVMVVLGNDLRRSENARSFCRVQREAESVLLGGLLPNARTPKIIVLCLWTLRNGSESLEAGCRRLPKLFKHAWKHWLKAQKEKGEDNPVLTRIENNNESQLLLCGPPRRSATHGWRRVLRNNLKKFWCTQTV